MSDLLFELANKVRIDNLGEGATLRGVVEFSNICSNNCAYCGLNRSNSKLERYILSKEEILDSAAYMHSNGIRTIILQSGENNALDPEWLADIIRTIKSRLDITVTLSVGEKPPGQYELWKKAGAERFLLKIETTDRELYEKLHPGMDFDNRVKCIDELKRLGYFTGSGIIVGLPGQTKGSIVNDLLFFKEKGLDMLGIGPFIPHPETELRDQKAGDPRLVLETIALTRLLLPKANIPATTALGSLDRDYRLEALKCGADTLMLNFTPDRAKELYELYPGRKGMEMKECSKRL